MENKVENKFLSLKEAAMMIGIHHYTLHEWIKKHHNIKIKNENELTDSEKKFRCPPFSRIGKRYRFTREDIEKFIKDSRDI